MTHDEHHWPFHHHHKHHPETPAPAAVVPILNESEKTMAADFSGVSAAQDPTTLAVALSGEARESQSAQVHFTGVVGAGPDQETLEGDVTRTVVADVPTVWLSFSDDHGGTWTVSEDGRTVTPPA